MPRMPRKTTSVGYMHVICRGIGKQVLFEEEMDYKYFLKLLRRFSEECNVTLVAYCLMENHVHLLVNDLHSNNISKFMQKIGVTYSGYYNRKYDRSGHLFQDRFRSETVEDERYLLTVFRYILNNPQKAGICPASSYRWSSYHSFGSQKRPTSLVDTSLLYQLIGGKKAYQEYMNTENDDQCMEHELPIKDDQWAKSVIHRCLCGKSGTFLQSLDKKKRNEYLRLLRREGLTIRQIARFTGIGRNIVQRV